MNLKTHILKYTFLTLLFVMAIAVSQAFSQEKIAVSGRVVDEQDQALVGVSIMLEGTSSGTITDLDGKFNLNCEAGHNLKFAFIGFKPLIVPATATMSIKMQPTDMALESVTIVGVGYGTMRKSDLTGAISSVSSKDFKQGVVNSSEQLLQGKVAGLTVIQGDGNPASGASIRLRGGTSLSASNGPLVVVDGIPGVDINTVQASEIQSMDVLKDASATAIYGSRGANGVIIVTTNRENKGHTLEYTGSFAIGKVAHNLDLLSADQWRKYVRDNNVKSAVDYGGNTDWQKELEQTSKTQTHAISYSTANQSNGIRASFNYMKSEGIIKKSFLNRMGASVGGFQYGLEDRLKLEMSIHANTDNWSNTDYSIFERAYNLNPTIPVMQNGAYTQLGGTNTNNPVEVLNNRSSDNTRKRVLGFGKAELSIIEGLKASMNLSYEYNSADGSFYQPSYSFYGITDKGYGTRTLGDYTNSQMESFLTYDKKIIGLGKMNIVAGYSYLDNVYSGFGASRHGFDSDISSYDNLGAGQDPRAGDVYSYKGESKLISFYGRFNFNLKDRYMLIGTLRRDGSSRFGDNNKWGTFPAISLGWRITEEAFMAGIKPYVNSLKLRLGYGVTGNQDGIGEYKSLFLLGAGGDPYYDATTGKWKQSYGPSQNPNPNLKWESTAQTNLGLDFTILDRINGTLDIYSKKTSDLLYTYSVPVPNNLYPTMLANVGDLSNKGIELSLNATLLKLKDFTWSANLNFAHNEQKVDKLSNDIYQATEVKSGSLLGLTGMSNTFSQILKEGYPVGTFYGPKYIGLDENGKYVFANNGKPEVLGNCQPKLSMGFSTNFTYKNFDLGVSTYGLFGQKVLNATAMNISYPGRLPAYNVYDSFLSSGIKSDPVYSSYWIEDASFLRLQSVTLGYTIPVNKFGVGKINCYVTGENLFVITGYKGIDPEVSIDGLATPGIDKLNYYPRPRTFMFGVKLSL